MKKNPTLKKQFSADEPRFVAFREKSSTFTGSKLIRLVVALLALGPRVGELINRARAHLRFLILGVGVVKSRLTILELNLVDSLTDAAGAPQGKLALLGSTWAVAG